MIKRIFISFFFSIFIFNIAHPQCATAFIVNNKHTKVYHLFSDCKALKNSKHKIIVTNEKHCTQRGLKLCKFCEKTNEKCLPKIDETQNKIFYNYPNILNQVPHFNQLDSVKMFIPDNKKYKIVPQIKDKN